MLEVDKVKRSLALLQQTFNLFLDLAATTLLLLLRQHPHVLAVLQDADQDGIDVVVLSKHLPQQIPALLPLRTQQHAKNGLKDRVCRA